MKVLLVDDNRLMVEGLQNLLEAHGIQIAGQAMDGWEAVDQARKLRPDVILMDIRMPGCNGLAATRLIKAEMPDTRIVILTTSTDDEDLFEAVKSGACGYLLKSMDAGELVEALHEVEEGTPPFSPGLAARLLNEFARLAQTLSVTTDSLAKSDTSASGLTARQTQVLALVSQGLSYKEAGIKLSLSPRTIKYHMMEIMQRLHLQNRAQVLAYAGRLGLRGDRTDK
jgi:DNA-binding NarL/FixJ family response regulator